MSQEHEHDPVNHSRHYRSANGVECIDVVETKSFNVGNAIKYLWRAGEKEDLLQDLQKAAWYVNREIRRLGGEQAPETPETVSEQVETSAGEYRQATIRVGRWDYRAEIDPNGVATYLDRLDQERMLEPGHYKVIRFR